ncbi:hypothetical protein CYMTET_6798 [Cymbomonas tetramitiformis]|uniref:Uncharacterized protein n=1 Tax=Cymbomonas tetramitiformis TaxID=36881 RepID=A0AAE0LI26_9CHLO|nr:hypothetical protein CYMTET_6798 [Cymbomonas tetramitiformis]
MGLRKRVVTKRWMSQAWSPARSDSDDEEIPLDEMPKGVVDQPSLPRRMLISGQHARAAVTGVEDYGAREYVRTSRQHGRRPPTDAYELLKQRMLGGITEEQLTTMAQVQPVCKLLNKCLAAGLAIVASGGYTRTRFLLMFA